MRALDPKAQEWLAAPVLPPHLRARLPEGGARCTRKAGQPDSLWQRFHDRLPGPRARRGQRHRLATVVAIAALATVVGKVVEGLRQSDGRRVPLLSSVTHATQWLLHQLPIAEKSNEITAFRPPLGPLPLSGVVLTADAEHRQRAHAQFLVYEKEADYLFLAKGNQAALEELAHTKLPGDFPPGG